MSFLPLNQPRNHVNGEVIIAAIIGAAPPTAVAWLAYRQAKFTHKAVNSRLTELLELTRTSSKAEGVLEQKAKE